MIVMFSGAHDRTENEAERILMSLDHRDNLYYYSYRHHTEPDRIGYQNIYIIQMVFTDNREIRGIKLVFMDNPGL